MSKLPSELQSLTAGLPPDKVADIEASIISSPYLITKIRKAVRESGFIIRSEYICVNGFKMKILHYN
jgi:hypothetical protein